MAFSCTVIGLINFAFLVNRLFGGLLLRQLSTLFRRRDRKENWKTKGRWGDGSDIAEAKANPRTLWRIATSLGRQEKKRTLWKKCWRSQGRGSCINSLTIGTKWHKEENIPLEEISEQQLQGCQASGCPEGICESYGACDRAKEGLGRLGFQGLHSLDFGARVLGLLLATLWVRGWWLLMQDRLHSNPGPATPLAVLL